MNKPGRNNKSMRRRYLLLLGSIAIASVAILLWQYYKHKIANKAIHKMVSSKSKGLYNIRYDSLGIDLALGTLHAKNVELVPDTAVYNQLVHDNKAPSALISIFIPNLRLLRIRTPKALLQKQIEGGKIEIDSPTIEIKLNRFMNDTSVYSPSKELYKQLLGNLLSIKIDSIAITHAYLIVKEMRSPDTLFRGENVSLIMSDLLIDSISKEDSSRILFSRNFDVTCEKVLLPSRKKDYKLHIEKLRFTSADNSFYIGRIVLAPLLSEEAFARAARLQKDRYDFSIVGVMLRNIRRESLWRKKIVADTLMISKSRWKIYRDLSYPHDTLNRVGKYPWQDLMRIHLPLLIKKIIISNAFIEYKEKNGKSHESGKVQFYEVNASIFNVTNIPSAIRQNNKCLLDFNSKFLNQTSLHANLTMFLKDPQGKFAISGNLGPIQAETLNPLTQPMALARIDKGMVDTVSFNFNGNDYASNGKIQMLYKDLKVSILKRDNDEGKKYSRKLLPSFFANIMVKKDNPSANGKARTEIFHYQRDIHKSFFNLLWKSVFTGIKQTAGVK